MYVMVPKGPGSFKVTTAQFEQHLETPKAVKGGITAGLLKTQLMVFLTLIDK